MKLGLCLIVLFLIAGCGVLLDNSPVPTNYSPTANATPINQTQNATINATPVVPQNILLPIKDKLGIYVLDTSVKGSSIITLNKKSMLINAQGGSDGLRILKILRNLGISKLDYLVGTNSEDDNIKGFPQMILRMSPKKLIHSGIPSVSAAYKTYVDLYPNESVIIIPHDTTFLFEDAVVDLIVPYDDGMAITEDSSVLVKVSYGDNSFLFASDCAVDCESRISNVKANILVSNGGCNSLSLAFLQDSNPEEVIFTGNPCKETIERINSLAIPYLVTANDGDVVISSDGKKYELNNLKS